MFQAEPGPPESRNRPHLPLQNGEAMLFGDFHLSIFFTISLHPRDDDDDDKNNNDDLVILIFIY